MSIFGPTWLEEKLAHLLEKEQGLVEYLIKKQDRERDEITTFVSSITLNNQKTSGKIMATKFKRTEQVTYAIVFTKKDGTPGDIQSGSFVIGGDNANVSVEPNSDNPLNGVIKGSADGTVNVNWTAKSLAGVDINGTVALTISDEPADTEVVATSITLSDPTPQQ